MFFKQTNINRIRNIILFFLLMIFLTPVYTQTTGKISGKVTDNTTGESLVGVNVQLSETNLGAATDENGDFYILNIPPGNYNIIVSIIGYQRTIIKDVRVNVNKTSNCNISLKSADIQGESVVVQAKKIDIKKGHTSSVRNVGSDQLETLPIEDIDDVITMQAGVVDGHFRGGRKNEVSYMIDGIPVDDAFNAESRVMEVETDAVEDLEIITGTFNAEYGRAMSGIVNAVTKTGTNEFKGSFSYNTGNYYTSNKNIFIGLDENGFLGTHDYKIQLSGPIIEDKIHFLTNYRSQQNHGYLFGKQRFLPSDYSQFIGGDPDLWYSEHNGNGNNIPMNDWCESSLMTKLSFKLFKNIKTSLKYMTNANDWEEYNHIFKYNPEGNLKHHKQSSMFVLNLNHMLTNNIFYEGKISLIENNKRESVYKNPEDERYVHDFYLSSSGSGFYTGGQNKNYFDLISKDFIMKFDINWQANKNHNFKTGIFYTKHNLDYTDVVIKNAYEGTPGVSDTIHTILDDGSYKVTYPNYAPEILPDSSVYSDITKVEPYEYAFYVQDKMEFSDMIVNFGIRLDAFDPNCKHPTDWRNPVNNLNLPDSMRSDYKDVNLNYQLSPRLGLAYELGKTASLHFSYGHFFQMPPMYSLYKNNSYRVAPTDYTTETGNPQLKPQKTVSYEIGLWQELIPGMSLEVALFYRDIYDLLSVKIVSTYNQIEYGLYTNKDYGNVRGLELKWDYEFNRFFALLNYTLQFTKGSADDPLQTFDRLGNNMDELNRMIPMEWDQRHTINVSVGYKGKSFGSTLTWFYNSGTPYTFSPIPESRLAMVNLLPNNGRMPSSTTLDLSGYYQFLTYKKFKVKLNWKIYNLLDQLNAEWVYGDTGQPYTTIIRENVRQNHRSNYNDFEDRIKDPSAYKSPRLIKIGLGLVF